VTLWVCAKKLFRELRYKKLFYFKNKYIVIFRITNKKINLPGWPVRANAQLAKFFLRFSR